MKNILYISLFGQLGGGEISLLTILKNLDRNKFFPRLICYSDGPLISKVKGLGVEVGIFQRDSFFSNFSLAWRIFCYIKKHKIELVHVNSLDIRAGLASFLAGTPFIGHLRVIFPFTWRDALFIKFSRRVIAVSNAVKEAFTKRFPVQKDKFVIIANAADIPDKPVKANLREEFGLGSQVRLIGAVGRIDPWKGYEYFIQSAVLIKKEFSDTAFFIIGDIFLRDSEEVEYLVKLKEAVKDSDLEGCFFFAGFREDILNVILALDILVIPSIELKDGRSLRTEGFGRVAIEGMAMGVPVVASNIGGLKEIIDDGLNGLLVSPKDLQAIKNGVLKLLRDTELRNRIICEGRKKVERLYTVQRQLELIAEVYEKVINTKE